MNGQTDWLYKLAVNVQESQPNRQSNIQTNSQTNSQSNNLTKIYSSLPASSHTDQIDRLLVVVLLVALLAFLLYVRVRLSEQRDLILGR